MRPGRAPVPELHHLCLLDRTPFNAESWFVTRALRVLRERIPSARALISYADPVPRHGERGARYAERQLIEAGAPVRRAGEEPRDYVARALREGPFRQVRHPGNLVYVMPLDEERDTRERLAPALPYFTRAQLGLSASGLPAVAA